MPNCDAQGKSGKHSLVHNITIATPCTANWNMMEGDEKVRYCGDCKLNVYNLVAMTESEAEKLIVETEGRLCLRLYRRTDGTVLTKDCPVGLRAKIKSCSLKTCAAIAAVISAVAAYVVARDTINAQNFKQAVQDKYEQNYCKLKEDASPRAPGGMSAAMGRKEMGDSAAPPNESFEMGKRLPMTK